MKRACEYVESTIEWGGTEKKKVASFVFAFFATSRYKRI